MNDEQDGFISSQIWFAASVIAQNPYEGLACSIAGFVWLWFSWYSRRSHGRLA